MNIMDVFGFRIVVDQPDACYRALGVVHNLPKPLPADSRLHRDSKNQRISIVTYRLFGMHGVPIEVQIAQTDGRCCR